MVTGDLVLKKCKTIKNTNHYYCNLLSLSCVLKMIELKYYQSEPLISKLKIFIFDFKLFFFYLFFKLIFNKNG